MRKTFGITLLVTSAFMFYSCVLHKEESSIASKIRLRSEPIFAVSKVVDGSWDFVCVLVELMKPEEIAKKLVGPDAKLLGTGNASRNILLDGESGLLVAKTDSKEYAIFLAFDHDKISFDLSSSSEDADKCQEYSLARLIRLKIATGPDWQHFELMGQE